MRWGCASVASCRPCSDRGGVRLGANSLRPARLVAIRCLRVKGDQKVVLRATQLVHTLLYL